MALKIYKDGQFRNFARFGEMKDGALRTFSTLYQYVDGAMHALWTSIRSCFGNGYWDNDQPWDNDDAWSND